MATIKTADGSFTLYSDYFHENYHSLAGAESESLNKFLLPSNLLCKNEIKVLDVGFGLGYNSFSLVKEVLALKKRLQIDAFELFEGPLKESVDFQKGVNQEILKSLLKESVWEKEKILLKMHWGDARKNILTLELDYYDAVFLDAFSPPKNPELWTLDFFRQIYSRLNSKGKVLTYSSALPVISAFMKAGFFVGYTPAFGRKRGGVIATKDQNDILYPLSDEDLYLIAVSARSIPNRDKDFWSKDQIQSYREKIMEKAKSLNIRLSHKKAYKMFLKNNKIGL